MLSKLPHTKHVNCRPRPHSKEARCFRPRANLYPIYTRTGPGFVSPLLGIRGLSFVHRGVPWLPFPMRHDVNERIHPPLLLASFLVLRRLDRARSPGCSPPEFCQSTRVAGVHHHTWLHLPSPRASSSLGYGQVKEPVTQVARTQIRIKPVSNKLATQRSSASDEVTQTRHSRGTTATFSP